MAKRIKENLDYTFSYKDLIVADRMMKTYLSDREKFYTDLFCSDEDYEKQDVLDYIEYFMSSNSSDMDIDAEESKHHKYLYNLHHFLSRNYEFNVLPSYCECIANITDCMYYFNGVETDEEIELFIENESETIENLKAFWNDFLNTMANYPLMHLDKLKHTCIMGCDIYYDPKADKFVLDSFLEFLQNVKRTFPSIISKFDRFLILDNEYVHYLADDGLEEDSGTCAFFTDDSIFLKSKCEDLSSAEERFFYKEVLFHEMGHYLFSKLPEYLALYWQQEYIEFRNKNLKMPRDDDKNSQLSEYMEECFADSFACWSFRDTEEIYNDDLYIHYPNQQIIDVFEFIIKKAFLENN